MSQLVIIGTENDVKRLVAEQEQAELEAIRARLRVAEIEDADERLKTLAGALDAQEKTLLEAYTVYDPDADVDFETALANARSMEAVERQFDKIGVMWTKQRQRVEYLAREAAK